MSETTDVWIATSETSNEGGFVLGVARTREGAMALADTEDWALADHAAKFGGWEKAGDDWERWTSESAFFYRVQRHKISAD